MRCFLIASAVLVAQVYSACCPPGGVWSEWVSDRSKCADNCGSCGTLVKNRTCTSAPSCPCSGAASSVEACDPSPCPFPRNFTCCPGFSLTVINDLFTCGKLPNTTVVDAWPQPSCTGGCCPVNGIWSEWRAVDRCSATCGKCGVVPRSRICLSQAYGCACNGVTTSTTACGAMPCVNLLANSSLAITLNGSQCCPNFAPGLNFLNGLVECVPLAGPPNDTYASTMCCDPSGTGNWNQWSSWSLCTGTCGMCGRQVRSRSCESAKYGCPCTGAGVQDQPCGSVACSAPTQCCAPSTLTTSFDGASICVLQPVTSSVGLWSDWFPVAGATCNDTCGGCGSTQSYRLCLPVGSQCTGAFFAVAPCNTTVCTDGRPSCCGVLSKRFDSNTRQFVCSNPNVMTATMPPSQN